MRIRLSVVTAALFLGALPIGLYAPAACAGTVPRAALVVDTGESDFALCVELPDESVTGIELVKLAGEQHDLQYSLGYGGEAVCQLAGVGPEGDDCFASYPDFWGYWRGAEDGGWTWSPSGAGSTTVEDGDVEGWSWGSGQDGTSHPQPPIVTFSEICEVAAGAEEEPETEQPATAEPGAGEPPAGGADGGDPAASEPNVGADLESEPEAPSTGTDEPGGTTSEEGAEAASGGPVAEEPAAPTPERRPHVALVAGDDDAEDPGPPIVGLIGLGLAIGLGITAATMAASRRRRGS
ncbi:MAG: hypothetical protein ACRDLB_14400 [Actinomycetota bacterium]